PPMPAPFDYVSCELFVHGGYADVRPAVGLLCEGNRSVHEGEQGVVFAHSHILAGIVYGTPLAYDDIARFGEFAAEQLHSEPLAFRLTTVLRATYSFLVCHLLRILDVKRL